MPLGKRDLGKLEHSFYPARHASIFEQWAENPVSWKSILKKMESIREVSRVENS